MLDTPASFKVLWGGRGAGKTECIARALIILCTQRKLRVACFREFQKNITESVYETIKNAIHDMEFDDEFTIQAQTIISKRTGSEFIFLGLRHNIDGIKSLARIDIAWVEEAANVSKKSWDKLEPTIRGRHESDPNGLGGPFGVGPEIWISFNPELDDDETYKRFVVLGHKLYPEFVVNENTGKKERYAIIKKVNWSDNPFFPADLRRKMKILKAANENEWLHIWEGNTKQVLDGAIYAQEIRKVLLENRRGKVPYDPSRMVHTFWDLGYDDYTSIWFVQQVGIYYNIINYFQDRLQKTPYYIHHLQSLEYNYGTHYLPHDADNETLASRSVYKIVKEAFPGKAKVVPRVPKKILGIRAARVIFDLCNFDEENTAEGWQCLTRYQWKVNDAGVYSKEPDHNEYSHGADAFQTFALSLKSETATKKPQVKDAVRTVVPFNNAASNWME